jgi:hypothetical protein
MINFTIVYVYPFQNPKRFYMYTHFEKETAASHSGSTAAEVNCG